MNIIGQRNVIKIIYNLITNNDKVNILLVAPSGHGKSLIGKMAGKIIFTHKNKRILYFSTGKKLVEFTEKHKKFNYNRYSILVDEIHDIYDPEIIFPLFEKTDIIATTNIMGLPEALENRFISIALEPYSDYELKMIFEIYYGNNIDEETFNKFLRITKTPRRLKNYAILYRSLGESFWELVIKSDNLTNPEIEYINALKNLGGLSSFGRIRAYLGYSPKYVQQLEVQLIEKGFIKITNKGRELLTEIEEIT